MQVSIVVVQKELSLINSIFFVLQPNKIGYSVEGEQPFIEVWLPCFG
jgi:hypothetical protein